MKISDWIFYDNAWMRVVEGAPLDDVKSRVAFIEKTPRIRIREGHFREVVGYYEDGGKYVEYSWDEWLDWCYGLKGETIEESKQWCDNMSRAMGKYKFPE